MFENKTLEIFIKLAINSRLSYKTKRLCIEQKEININYNKIKKQIS